SWVPSATISRPTWALWKMQSVVFLPEKMLPSPHKPEFQSRTRAPPCCQRVGTSINNLYFRRRIHHASRYFSNLDLFFRLPGNSFSDFHPLDHSHRKHVPCIFRHNVGYQQINLASPVRFI